MGETSSRLKGTGVALVTPFTASLDVDYEAFEKILAHTAAGADYWVVNGTTAESPTLSQQERIAILEFAKKHRPEGFPIVFGLGRNSTKETISALAEVDLDGVDTLLTVSPYYNKPSQDGLFAHYTALADASPKPIILYNVPGRTGSNINASTVLELAKHPNIIGIKEASGDLAQCMQIAKEKPSDFLLISGDDMLTSTIMGIGGEGVISVAANLLPQEMKGITDASLEGDILKAGKDTLALIDIFDSMFAEGNPVGIKAALAIAGYCNPSVRLPLSEASASLTSQLTDQLDNTLAKA